YTTSIFCLSCNRLNPLQHSFPTRRSSDLTNAEVARRPLLSAGLVYIANANDTVIAADAKTGQVRWSQHRTPAMGMEIAGYSGPRSEEHTSELQSRENLVCRLLLEKKKKKQ